MKFAIVVMLCSFFVCQGIIRNCNYKDKDSRCAGWAKIGECRKNPRWMEVNCKKSCFCDGNCIYKDHDKRCPGWAKIGECQKDPGYMEARCKKSCICVDNIKMSRSSSLRATYCNYKDKDTGCAGWAKIGECRTNPAWMKDNCKKSCFCDDLCKDTDARCYMWARTGKCSMDATMKTKCCTSCTDLQVNCKDEHAKCLLWKDYYCNTEKSFMHVICRKSCNICKKLEGLDFHEH